jgi:hypothetical protein
VFVRRGERSCTHNSSSGVLCSNCVVAATRYKLVNVCTRGKVYRTVRRVSELVSPGRVANNCAHKRVCQPSEWDVGNRFVNTATRYKQTSEATGVHRNADKIDACTNSDKSIEVISKQRSAALHACVWVALRARRRNVDRQARLGRAEGRASGNVWLLKVNWFLLECRNLCFAFRVL